MHDSCVIMTALIKSVSSGPYTQHDRGMIFSVLLINHVINAKLLGAINCFYDLIVKGHAPLHLFIDIN